jgi:hypothetical protein
MSDCVLSYSQDGKSWTDAPLKELTARLAVTAFQRIRSPESGIALTYGAHSEQVMQTMTTGNKINRESYIRVSDGKTQLTARVMDWTNLIQLAGKVEKVNLVPTAEGENPESKRALALAELQAAFA